MESHYDWLGVNFPIFCRNLGIDGNHFMGLIQANGDKCYSAEHSWSLNGIPFYHGVSMYLLTSIAPYCDEVRNTPNGWVSPFDWVISNKERFTEHLPLIN